MLLIAGPSGCGKSRLADRSGLTVLQLDDFYRAGDDPALPRLAGGDVDWDHPGSWHADQAVAAIESICRTGSAEVPIYDIAANGPHGSRTVAVPGGSVFVAEGIFVAEVIRECAIHDLLARAVCVRRSRWITMGLRLFRDLREHRKPPLILLRRGWLLAEREPAIVRRLLAAGCEPTSPGDIRRILARVAALPNRRTGPIR